MVQLDILFDTFQKGIDTSLMVGTIYITSLLQNKFTTASINSTKLGWWY